MKQVFVAKTAVYVTPAMFLVVIIAYMGIDSTVLTAMWCRDNRVALDKIVERLIVDETIRGEDFREMLSKYTKIPESNMATPTTVESSIPANI